MMYLGIDPGCNGCIALLDWNGKPVEYLKLKDATEADIAKFVHENLVGLNEVTAAVEFVRSTPQMGVVSAFTFGRSYGFLRGVLAANGIRREDVTPQKWQAELGCRSKGDKNVTKAKAQELWPEEKITHANADALLIAEYARRMKTQGKL
jgi:hypothetical protein